MVQLSMVTEERDNLRNTVHQLKRPKNEEAGDEGGTVVQVLKFYVVLLL